MLSKMIRYAHNLPYKVEKYGFWTTFNKVIVDIGNKTGIAIPRGLRWRAAHQFHTNWKLAQRDYYGIEEYNRRIDLKSVEVLEEFYEVGTDFTGKTVCDVGCGTRGILPVINAKQKIGVDPTIGKIRSQIRLYNDAIYLSEKAEDITLGMETVDIVACNNALNHFENPELALAQMHRILRKDGLLLLEVFIEPVNIAHTIEFSEQGLTQLLQRYFTPIRVKHERLRVKVEIDEKLDGELPMRWGGVFRK